MANSLNVYRTVANDGFFIVLKAGSHTEKTCSLTTQDEAMSYIEGFNKARAWVARDPFVIIVHDYNCIVSKACVCVGLKR